MKKHAEKISVIVPIYNADKYLKQCLRSIIDQSYENLDIILINDGSKDQSGNICDDFAKMDSRINVIHKTNSGVADCRNIGLSQSKGDYIVWVDADDYIDRFFVEHMYEAMKNNQSDIVQCRFVKVNDGNYKFETEKSSVTNYSRQIVLEGYAEEKDSVSSIYLWDKLFRKALFENISFPLRSNSEDRAVLCQVLARIKVFTQIEDVMYAYRLSENSLTRGKMNYGFIKSAIDTENERVRFFKGLGDETLYHKALIAYEKVMIATYSRCILKMKDKKLAKKIFSLYRHYYKAVIRNKNLNFVRKGQFVFFRYFPSIYAFTIFNAYDLKTKR